VTTINYAGDIWFSNNNGESWIYMSDKIPGLLASAVGSIGDTLFVYNATPYLYSPNGAGIYRSTDNGFTWSKPPPPEVVALRKTTL